MASDFFKLLLDGKTPNAEGLAFNPGSRSSAMERSAKTKILNTFKKSFGDWDGIARTNRFLKDNPELADFQHDLVLKGTQLTYTILVRSYGKQALEGMSLREVEKMTEKSFDLMQQSIDSKLVNFNMFEKGINRDFFSKGNYSQKQEIRTQAAGQGTIGLRSGRIVNMLQLTNILNVMLAQEAGSLMRDYQEQGSNLKYRTGRLANSGTVTNIKSNFKEDSPVRSIWFTYMLRPYKTFDEGGKQQRPDRMTPSQLFSEAIGRILVRILGNAALQTNRFRLLFGSTIKGTVTRGDYNER